jgi:uncharacterized protein YacL
MTGLGALLAASQVPIGWQADGEAIRPIWLNALIGAFGGALLAGLMHTITIGVTRGVEEEGEGLKLLNGALTGLVGALFGLLGYAILELLFAPSLWLQAAQALLIGFLTFLGFRIGYRRDNLLLELISGEVRGSQGGAPKLLDTSVIIDGRIKNLVKTGFLEGPLLIPQFVLEELQKIADSADSLKRRKGRRGLDILAELRRLPDAQIEILDRDYPGTSDVDRKLIRLAKDLEAKIITTDFNLNKVAKVEDVPVLNINELANALKPEFLPGEEIEVEVIDRGQEIGQGVGYLDDGTMVVVENGRRYIGKKIRAVVSSSLQTEAGKMLFVRPKGEVDGKWQQQEE